MEDQALLFIRSLADRGASIIIYMVPCRPRSKLLFLWSLADQGASNDSYELFSLINLMLYLKLIFNLTLQLELVYAARRSEK